ncbi:MAG: CRTAC1 family protein [Chloroflexota bacterium]|nr:CRTAC1 family protein [Chloroflexota bacterium]
MVRQTLRTTRITCIWLILLAMLSVIACSEELEPLSPRPAPPALPSATSIPKAAVIVAPSPQSKSQEGAKREEEEAPDITPFINVASQFLRDGHEVNNYRPAVVVFDYDRDGDSDLYITSNKGNGNLLYRNEGNGNFNDMAQDVGAALSQSNSSGAVACDLNNDGYQDLYVGARGIIGDGLDFRSAMDDGQDAAQLRDAIQDHLLLNNGDGSFIDITEAAFGDAVNLRSASSIACADIDGDGWLDIYVGNAVDEDWFMFDQPSHPGHYNRLYRNNGDLTFEEISESAGVEGGEITLRYEDGSPIMFEDEETGAEYEGYDPNIKDTNGNRVADPSGRTHAVLFFDYDDDGDQDLWAANDGHRPYVFRNDSTAGDVRFTPVAKAMGIDKSGNWMGFAVGDYDGDVDLDVFIPNVGYHLRLLAPQQEPGGDCKYTERFEWGTCLHYMLRNDGTRKDASLGVLGVFPDVVSDTRVEPSPLMPPRSLDKKRIHPDWEAPTGLGAYDFGYGTTFFDYDNDGQQDLYWLGSEGPPGNSSFPAAGRMLKGDGAGGFEDITVRAHLLDIRDVDYSILDVDDPDFNADKQRISNRFHLNGKGLAHGDLNGDGYLDLIGTNSSGPRWDDRTGKWIPELGPIFVWLNGGGDNHWITLLLKGRMGVDGTGSNADAVGARVYLVSGGRTQVQEVRTGSSYLSMDSIALEFGLGSAALADEIRVRWPSGRTQVIDDVPADQVVQIVEPES